MSEPTGTDPVAGTQASYAAVAAQYAARSAATPFAEELSRFRALLPAGARVADVGCGPGRQTVALRELGLDVVGLDLSAAMLRTGGLDGVVRADMRRLPVRTASLDGVWCQAALLHVPLADAPTALGELARVLRPGGVLHLSIAEGDGEGWLVDRYPGHPRWYAHHREQPLTAALTGLGLVVREVRRRVTHRDWLIVLGERSQSRGVPEASTPPAG